MTKPGKIGFHPEAIFGLLTMVSVGFIADGFNAVRYTDATWQVWLGFITSVFIGNIFLQTTIDFFMHRGE